MNKRQIGAKGEQVAIAYLTNQSYELIDQNVYTPFGEIDLICKKNDVLYFVEVKWRNSSAYGLPIEAMTPSKIKHFKRSVIYYLKVLDHYVSQYHLSFVGIMPKKTMTVYEMKNTSWQLDSFDIQFLKDIF